MFDDFQKMAGGQPGTKQYKMISQNIVGVFDRLPSPQTVNLPGRLHQ
ncbi:hypothetical protein [Thalassoglobus neptunius]|nr:hypothetical protein [Thalassoglobus neptunius]